MNLLQIHEPGQTPLPHTGVRAIGIDLGTTHTVAAVADAGRAEVIRDAEGNALLPSVVHYGAAGVEVGESACERLRAGEEGVIASVKRRMHTAAERIKAAGREVTPVEVSAEILRAIKRRAEEALGGEVRQAVITVPAYFDDAARTATKHAAALAGIEVLRLLSEPTAAALAYGLESGAEGIYAVYDLGGGTFDISLLKLEKGVFQVLATGGDTQLGGDDFDRAVAEHLGLSENGSALAKARELKETLSEQGEVSLRAQRSNQAHTLKELDCLVASASRNDEVFTRAQFETLVAPLVDRTITICRRVLRDAKLSPEQVKGVVLVGGSTRVPLVRAMVEECFGKPPLSGVNPDEVVAVGAALQAGALTQGSDTLLLDVVPLSLGLETMGGLTEKLIYRNTPIPTSAAQEFTTWQDGQTGMQIHAVQGEREMVADNRSLARFELKDIPPLPAGIARVRVSFTVDADGLLTVSAEEVTTGAHQAVEVRPSFGLSEEEMEYMLLESMERAKDDIMGRLLAEARVEAERTIIEIESAMAADGDLLSDPERQLIASQVSYLREAAKEGDRERIDMEMQQLAMAGQAFAERRMDRAVASVLKGQRIENIKG